MRIFVATGIFHPEAGGPATYLYHMLPELQKRGHAITVLTFGDVARSYFQEDPYPVFRVSRRSSYWRRQWDYYRTAARLWPTHDVAFIHSLNIPLPRAIRPCVAKIVGDPAWERAVNRGWIPPHTDIDRFQSGRYRLPVEINRMQRSALARRFDRIIVPSEYLKQLVVGWGVDPSRIWVIYNALAEQIAPPPEDQAAARLALGIPAGPLLLTVARLTAWKGIAETLHALVRLPTVRLVIAGDGPMRGDLEVLSVKLGLVERVTFLGHVAREKMPLYYRAADFTLLYSGYEGLSHVLLESLTVGTPVIASDKGGNPEVVRHGVNGLLVPCSNVGALADVVAQAFSPGQRDHLAANASQGLERFSWQSLVDQTIQLLESFEE